MTCKKSLLQNIDTYMICEVTIGDEKSVKIKGISIIIVGTNSKTYILIHDFYFILELAHNLLSVGQLLECNFIIHFEDNTFVIKYKKSDMSLMMIPKVAKRIFPLDISRLVEFGMITKDSDSSSLCCLHYGHIYISMY